VQIKNVKLEIHTFTYRYLVLQWLDGKSIT